MTLKGTTVAVFGLLLAASSSCTATRVISTADEEGGGSNAGQGSDHGGKAGGLGEFPTGPGGRNLGGNPTAEAGAGSNPTNEAGAGSNPTNEAGAGSNPTNEAGAGGVATGGVAEEAGAGGNQAGAGGDDNTGPLTQTQACTEQCHVFFGGHGPCGDVDEPDCVTFCSTYDVDRPTNDLFLSYLRCADAKLASSSDYQCGAQPGLTVTPMWPVAAGACEKELCAWSCADQTWVDTAVFMRCGC